MTQIQVSQLTIHPVKSLRGIALETMQLGAKGPELDRRWLVVDSKGVQRTQRQFARMSLVDTALEEGRLTLSAEGAGSCTVNSFEVQASATQRDVQVWRDTVSANDCGDDAAQWLSDFLGVDCRLMYMPDESQRLVDPDYAHHQETVGFADAFPILLGNEASLEDFNHHLNDPVQMNRFRPNIVVSGAEAWAEDSWKTIRIAGLTLSIASPCSRCIMPSINPQTGEKQMEVIDALNKHRRVDRATYFGQNVLYQQLGSISVGDIVEVVE
ncbi:MAG: MOSC N-terminal beta barrel domain-containing protein [Pseudomonadota bacterium]